MQDYKWRKILGKSENAVLENDGQTFSKLWTKLRRLEKDAWKKTDIVLANSENIPFVIVYNEQL